MKTPGASVQMKARPQLVGFKFLAVLSILAGAGLAGSADAAPASRAAAKLAKETVTSVSARDVETTSSVQGSTGDDPYCNVSRKRLFVEGEGWIVRRVTTCY